MSAVIGLYLKNQDVVDQIRLLEEAGYPKDRIRVISQQRSINQLLDCYPNRIVTKYAGWGAFIGIGIYGVFALVASWCECYVFQFSHTIGFQIVLVGVLFGAFAGAFIGCFAGMAEYEKDTQLYTRGIRLGNKVLVLEINPEESEQAKTALRNIGCTGIRAREEPDKEKEK